MELSQALTESRVEVWMKFEENVSGKVLIVKVLTSRITADVAPQKASSTTPPMAIGSLFSI